MAAKKKSEKKVEVEQSGASDVQVSVAGVDPVPSIITQPPEGWIPRPKIGRKGRKPKLQQATLAPAVAAELRAAGSSLVAELGPNTPDADQIAAALEQAHGWSGAAVKAKTYSTYARAQNSAAWDGALGFVNTLAPGVAYALSRDPAFAERFPSLTKMIAAGKRGKDRRTKGDAAPPADPSGTPEPSPPSPPATINATKPE